MLTADDAEFTTLLKRLDNAAAAPDADNAWPAEQFDWLAEAGVLGWMIPSAFGGSEVPDAEMTRGYRRLAQACLVSTFVLTQRNGACQRIAGSDNEALKAALLPGLASGELFATVGISHLTTSRQHLARPAVQVRETNDGFVFSGLVPWVTGAPHADHIVTGGALDDGRQILAAVPTATDEVTVLEPAQLLALTASQTGPIRLDDVPVPYDQVIAGPIENVMQRGAGGGAGSLTTSALAAGVAARALASLGDESSRRPDLVDIHRPLKDEHGSLCAAIDAVTAAMAIGNPSPHSSESIRQRANSLVLRSTQAWLAASKGAGFVKGHPAERAVREAMFFLVWSCPQPVLSAALREFACLIDTP